MDWPWWGVLGLVMELAGFGVLAWDLLRDYAEHGTQRQLRLALAMYEGLEPAPALEGEEAKLSDTIKAMAAGVRRGFAADELRLALGQATRRMPASKSVQALTEEARKLVAAPQSAGTKRPPVVAGIFAIVAGVAMQVVAAWPAA